MKTQIKHIFWVVELLLLCIFTPQKAKGQEWKNENKGLYPQSIQLNINPRNTALGIRYGYLFQEPVFGMPLGVYGTFSNTIHPNPDYCNYKWERKYSIGLSISLPNNTITQPESHFMATVAAVYNSHPTTNQDWYLPTGQFRAGYYNTSNFGCDLGIMMQHRRFACHLKTDVFNFMKYVEVGAGYAFYRIRK